MDQLINFKRELTSDLRLQGSMMAPHVNPDADEFAIVTVGKGKMQITYPNGTSAFDAEVSEGNVIFFPKFFAFCQIASRTGPFEFVGFTTSSHRNHPQFLAGASSVYHTLRGPEMARAFDMAEDDLGRFLDAQSEAIILPSAEIAPPYKEEEKGRQEEEKRERRDREAIRSLEGNIMGMGFD